jgi:spore germination cell wall hydrolase CwlJ-like protein
VALVLLWTIAIVSEMQRFIWRKNGKQPYSELSELAITALAVYREARGEPYEGKQGVAHVIKNRADKPSAWWVEKICQLLIME